MFESIKRIFNKTKNATLVRNAVAKGFITEAEFSLIVGVV